MEQIKKIIENLFRIIGLEKPEINIEIDNSVKGKEVLNIDLNMDVAEAELFIRNNSEALSALQHIAKILVSKQHPTYAFLNLDINSYRESRKNELAEIALQVAKRVRRTKKTVVLEPMPAFERRIIHLKLAEQPDIITESIGQEPERRIMVRLYP